MNELVVHYKSCLEINYLEYLIIKEDIHGQVQHIVEFGKI